MHHYRLHHAIAQYCPMVKPLACFSVGCFFSCCLVSTFPCAKNAHEFLEHLWLKNMFSMITCLFGPVWKLCFVWLNSLSIEHGNRLGARYFQTYPFELALDDPESVCWVHLQRLPGGANACLVAGRYLVRLVMRQNPAMWTTQKDNIKARFQ